MANDTLITKHPMEYARGLTTFNITHQGLHMSIRQGSVTQVASQVYVNILPFNWQYEIGSRLHVILKVKVQFYSGCEKQHTLYQSMRGSEHEILFQFVSFSFLFTPSRVFHGKARRMELMKIYDWHSF